MKKYQTKWNLGLLYKNDKDPQIEKDIQTIEKACADFEKKYKKKDFTGNAKNLLTALKDKEKLSEIFNGNKPWWYFALKTDLQSYDAKAGALATKIEQRLEHAFNRLTFFHLVIGAIPKNKQKEYLNDPILKDYAYSLEQIFSHAQYNLSEKEEQLENLLSQTSYTMWVDGQQKVLSQKTISFRGEDLPIAKALSILADQSEEDRSILNEEITKVLKRQSLFAEAELNAIYNYKKIMDDLRGYKNPYSATVLAYENDEKTVLDLVKTVTSYFNLSSRFYTLHAKLLNKKEIAMQDRAVKIGEIKKKFDFDTTVGIVKYAFSKVDRKYADFVDYFLVNGQIDVLPQKGKKGGAYCWGMGPKNPTFVLLNHTDDIRSIETLAHEMGHAIHTELSKKQPIRYQKYSSATAEVASTFFEQLVSEEIESYLDEDEKIILLHNKIMGDISTIFRQIACFNFELELHQSIRGSGQLNAEAIAKLLQKHMQAYTGKNMKVTTDDGYFYVWWSHIRNFFYVYSYAYGQLVSRALYEKWKQNPTYATKIAQFLSAGRSMSPKDIFKSVGINTNKAFFESGLKAIENDIKKLEKLAKKQKRI